MNVLLSHFFIKFSQYSNKLRITKNIIEMAIPIFETKIKDSLSKNKNIRQIPKIIENNKLRKDIFFDIINDFRLLQELILPIEHTQCQQIEQVRQ